MSDSPATEAAATAPPAAAVPGRLLPQQLLNVNALKETEFEVGAYTIWLENDVPLERIMLPGYWANHAKHIKVGSVCQLMRRDFPLDVTVRVIRVEPGLVFVRHLIPPYVDDSGIAQTAENMGAGPDMSTLPEGYKLGHNPKPPTPGHFVQLKANGEIVARGLKSAELALGFAVMHAKASMTPATQPKAA